MGYTNEKSQLMTVPPYVLGCIMTISIGVLADRQGKRGVYMMLCCFIAMVGFALLLSSHIPAVQYVGTFLAVSGIYPNVPMGVAWNGNNIGGSTKRAVGIAMHVGFGNLGGSIAAFAYRKTDAPRYFSGHGLLLATTTMSFFLCAFMRTWLIKENARRDEEAKAKGLTLHDYTEEMKESEREKGDSASVSNFSFASPRRKIDCTASPVLPLHFIGGFLSYPIVYRLRIYCISVVLSRRFQCAP